MDKLPEDPTPEERAEIKKLIEARVNEILESNKFRVPDMKPPAVRIARLSWGKILGTIGVAAAGGIVGAMIHNALTKPASASKSKPRDQNTGTTAVPAARARLVFDRQRGESQSQYNERAWAMKKEDGVQAKKEAGRWLPTADYEALTGRRGRKD